MSAQLDIFETTEISMIKDEVKQYKESADNVRKGVFARLSSHKEEIGKMFLDLHKEHEELKQELYNLKKLLIEKSM